MQEASKFNLTIERMIYGGDGFARLPAEPGTNGRGKAVFIPFVAPGESVEARIVEETPGFVRAEAEYILEASPHRVQPVCEHYAACGGCHYQHIDYKRQIAIKADILRETLRRNGNVELKQEIQTHAGLPWLYRNRVRLHLNHRPVFAVGYHRFHSNELLAVSECPISAPLLARAIELIRQIGLSGGMPPWVREIELFINHDESSLLVEFLCDARTFSGRMGQTFAAVLEHLAEQFSEAIPQFLGVTAFEFAQSRENPDAPPRLAAIAGQSSLTYSTLVGDYHVSAGSFFQSNRYLLDEMVNIVTAGKYGAHALDLYAGVGLFSLPLALVFDKVTAVESAYSSYTDLEHNAQSTNGKLTTAHSTTQEFLRKRRRADYVVVDPPRGGLGTDVCHELTLLEAPRICYVSCDPATLARDLKQLMSANYRIAEAHLIDMFPQTFHIESVFHLVK